MSSTKLYYTDIPFDKCVQRLKYANFNELIDENDLIYKKRQKNSNTFVISSKYNPNDFSFRERYSNRFRNCICTLEKTESGTFLRVKFKIPINYYIHFLVLFLLTRIVLTGNFCVALFELPVPSVLFLDFFNILYLIYSIYVKKREEPTLIWQILFVLNAKPVYAAT